LAPVKGPASWPKSSLSASDSGNEPQLSGTKWFRRRSLLVVQAARHQFLAGAGLAVDQHVDRGLGQGHHRASQLLDLS
jgi:hypothetical protein